MAEFNAHLSCTDSGADNGAARVNTPPAPLSIPLATHRCRYMRSWLTKVKIFRLVDSTLAHAMLPPGK